MEISRDFEEFFELLNKNKVRYLVVGGYAYAIHAEPRYTKDLDILVERSAENAERLISSLREFGFESTDLNAEDFQEVEQIIQLGNEPLRIDLLTSIDGVKFSEIWDNKITAEYGKQEINVIGRQDFIKNKRATNRPQDRIDVDKMQEGES